MDRAVMIILFLFLFLIIFAQNARSNYAPLYRTTIQVEIQSDKLDEAFALLDQHKEYKEYVEDHINVLRTGKLTKIIINHEESVVEMSNKFIDTQDVTWLASVLVHEARHHEQWVHNMKMTDQEYELDANRVMATALYYMGGSKSSVTELLSQNGLHFDSNGNGYLDIYDDWGY